MQDLSPKEYETQRLLPWYAFMTVGFLAVGMSFYMPVLTSQELLGDELAYGNAIQLLKEGHSPYEHPRYVYPSLLARAGKCFAEIAGMRKVILFLRALNLAGVVLVVIVAVQMIGSRWWIKIGVGVLLLLLAPPVRSALHFGNVAGVVGGATVMGLMVWPQYPIMAGFFLALAVLLKPNVLLGVLVLLVHRPLRSTRRHLMAGSIALLVAALTIAGWPGDIAGMLRNVQGLPPAESSVALPRLLYNLGLDVPWWIPSLVVAVAGTMIARYRVMALHEVMILGGTLTVLASPVVWCHTFILVLSLVTLASRMALQEVWEAGREESRSLRERALLPFLGVVGGVIPLFTSDLWTLSEWPPLLQAMGGFVPLGALILLTRYVLRSPGGHKEITPRFSRGAS